VLPDVELEELQLDDEEGLPAAIPVECFICGRCRMPHLCMENCPLVRQRAEKMGEPVGATLL
jgi:hypothetical protein